MNLRNASWAHKAVPPGMILLASHCSPSPPAEPGAALLEAALEQAFVAGGHTLEGGWTLGGSDGSPVGVADLLGTWSLVGVGYTSCPDVCPATLTAMPALVDAVTERIPAPGNLQVLFIAVDPARDTDGLEAYRTHFAGGVSVPLRAATGRPEGLKAAANDLGLAFEVNGHDVQHSTAWALVAPSGRVEGYLLHPTDPARCLAGADTVLGVPWKARPPVVVESGWLRPPPPGSKVGAAYGRVRNHSEAARKLVGAARVDGSSVAVHETVVEAGIARMLPTDVDVPSGGEARLEPMGAHLMVPMTHDESSLSIRLTFDDGTSVWGHFDEAAAP